VTDSFVSLTAGWVGNRNQNTPRGISGLCARQIYRCLPLVYVGFDLHLEMQYLRRPSYPALVCLFRSTRRNTVFVKGYLKEKNETAKCNGPFLFIFWKATEENTRRLRVVSNFGDGDCGADEIHTRARNFEETRREGSAEKSNFRRSLCVASPRTFARACVFRPPHNRHRQN